MGKPEKEFHIPDAEWQPAGPPGFWERVLAKDPDTGDYTRIARLDPGTDTSDQGSLSHEFHEEAYILEGELTDLTLGETFTPGMYACRQPGMVHGPYRTEKGCLLIEYRYGFE